LMSWSVMVTLLGMSGEAEKRIALAFSTNGTFRAMSRINPEVISQWEDLPPHTFYKQFMAAARKIGSAHRAGKKTISGKYRSGCVKAHAAGRMPGSVDDRDAVVSDLEGLSFFQKAVGPCTETACVQTVNQDRSLCDALQLRDAAHVVYMAVGDGDVFYGKA
jgi:hypothetical protein